MKQIIIIILIVVLSGCTAFSPVVKDKSQPKQSEKKEIVVDKPKVVKVHAENSDERINITQNEKKISPEDVIFTISNLNISSKNNGVLIKLNYNGNNPEENVTTFFSGDNFFNISFYKGKFSDSVKNYIYNKSIVGSVKFFEFKDSVQITIRLKEDYRSSLVSTDKKAILISVFN